MQNNLLKNSNIFFKVPGERVYHIYTILNHILEKKHPTFNYNKHLTLKTPGQSKTNEEQSSKYHFVFSA